MRKIIALLFIFIFILLFSQKIYGQQNAGEVAKKIEEYQKKVTELGRQRDTLSFEECKLK